MNRLFFDPFLSRPPCALVFTSVNTLPGGPGFTHLRPTPEGSWGPRSSRSALFPRETSLSVNRFLEPPPPTRAAFRLNGVRRSAGRRSAGSGRQPREQLQAGHGGLDRIGEPVALVATVKDVRHCPPLQRVSNRGFRSRDSGIDEPLGQLLPVWGRSGRCSAAARGRRW